MSSIQKLLLTTIALAGLSPLHAQILGALPPRIDAEQPDWAYRGVPALDTATQVTPRKCFVLDIDTTATKPVTTEMIQAAMLNKRYREVDCSDLKKKNE